MWTSPKWAIFSVKKPFIIPIIAFERPPSDNSEQDQWDWLSIGWRNPLQKDPMVVREKCFDSSHFKNWIFVQDQGEAEYSREAGLPI